MAEAFNPYLRHLIAQYEYIGMVWLGKVPDPAKGEIHRELDQVKEVVGFLEMLEAKTSGNLTEDEARELRRALTLLRLNYVEELRKPEAAAPETGSAAAAGESGKPAEAGEAGEAEKQASGKEKAQEDKPQEASGKDEA